MFKWSVPVAAHTAAEPHFIAAPEHGPLLAQVSVHFMRDHVPTNCGTRGQDEDELHHHMFIFDREATRDLRRAAPDELTACCWDLSVIGYERDAWVETILKNASGPDHAAYLATRLDAQV